ncbi:MAG: hypothetical protein AB7I18_04845 [Candidatus Berkiella sp.]
MADRYNIYDWVGDRSKQRLQQLLSKYDIKVDENKQNKQQVLSQVLNTLRTAEEVFELKKLFLTPDPLDKNFIEAQNADKNLIELKCNIAIKRKQIEHAIEEAVSTFVVAEQMKKMHEEVQDLIKKEAAEKDQAMKEAYRSATEQMQQDLRNYLDRLQKQAMSDMLKHKANIERLDKEIAELKAQKEATFVNGAKEALEQHKQTILPSGKRLNDYMTDSQAIRIQESLAREMYKREELKSKEVKELKSELKDIKEQKAQINQSQKQVRSSSVTFMPGYNGAQKSLSTQDSVKLAKLEAREKEIDTRLKELEKTDPKATQRENQELFKDIAKKEGVDVNNIPPQDLEQLGERFIEQGEKICKEVKVIDEKIEEKNEEKIEELSSAKLDYNLHLQQREAISEEYGENENRIKGDDLDIDDLFASLTESEEEPKNRSSVTQTK